MSSSLSMYQDICPILELGEKNFQESQPFLHPEQDTVHKLRDTLSRSYQGQNISPAPGIMHRTQNIAIDLQLL